MKSVSALALWASLLTASFSFPAAASETDAALAQKARAVFAANCFRCHGDGGSHAGGMNYILNSKALVREKQVVPGDAAGSELYQRVSTGKMPPKEDDAGKPVTQRPGPADVAVLKQWIEAGAPDMSTAVVGREFRSPTYVLQQIHDDLYRLKGKDRTFARYFTLTHLFNAGVPADDLETTRGGLSKLVNSLSWKKDIVRPQPIDTDKTIFRIDLRDYGWDAAMWDRILADYPYGEPQTDAVAMEVHTATDSESAPCVRGDWFVYVASRPPLYHDVLRLPDNDRALEENLLRIDVARDVSSEAVARAGFNGSGVSQNNRLIERHETDYGAYHKSRDFGGSDGCRNLFAHPLDYQPDGGELIWNLPNGLQAYMLVNAKGKRIDVAPTSIVSDAKQPDRAVRNGVSCMSCHFGGVNEKNDQIRETLELNPNLFSAGERDKILALYPPRAKFSALLHKDAVRFQKAVEETGAVLGAADTEPISTSARRFDQDLDLPLAAAEAGVKPDELLQLLGRAPKLAEVFGAFRLPGGTVKREVYVAHYIELVREVRGGDVSVTAAKQLERADGLRAKGNLEAALQAYNDAVAQSPQNALALFGRARCRYAMKQYAESIEDNSAVIRLQPKYHAAYSNRGMAYYLTGDHAKAFDDFSRAIELGSKHVFTFVWRGEIYRERDDYKNANADYGQAIEIDANNADAYFGRARCAYKQKDYDSAVADNSTVIRLAPKNHGAFSNRGLANYYKGDHAAAFDDFTRAIDLGSEYAPTFKHRGEIYRERKDYKSGLADFTRAAELDPKFADNFFGKGQCHYALKQYADCIDDYTAAIRLAPKYHAAFSNRGLANFYKGDHDAAFDDFTRAIELGSEYPANYFRRADVYRERKDYKSALADCTRATELDPKSVDGFFGKGQCHYLLKQYADCIEDYTTVIRLAPRNAAAFSNRGLAYFEKGDHAAAFDDFTRAIDLGTEYVPNYIHRGDIYQEHKDYKNATIDYRKALDLDPQNVDAKRKLDDIQRLNQ